MLRGLLLSATLATLALLCAATSTHATAPTARLSWSRDAIVEDLSAPPGAHTALYLRITAPPPGFTALASEIRWTPNSILGPCYGLFADSALSQPDGWWAWQTPPMALGDDSTYHYALHPRESGGDIIIKMMFGGGAGCGSIPATICLNMVKFVEASGETAYAEILGGATVLGGDGDCGIGMQQLSPTVVGQDQATTFDVVGHGFDELTAVRLVSAAGGREATEVNVLSSGHLVAALDTRGLTGEAQVQVIGAGGDTVSTTALITGGAPLGVAYDPVSVILWTKPGRLTLPQGEVAASPTVASGAPSLTAQLAALGVQEIRNCSPATLLDPQAAASLASRAQLDIFVLALADTNVIATCNVLIADSANTITCHPNWLMYASEVVPSDALMPKSWHLRNVGSFPAPNAVPSADSRAARAWDTSVGGTPIRVGVIDTGSWTSHPDLLGRYLNGWKAVEGWPYDDIKGHGAPVAGIIGALGAGGGQAVGVNWSAEILSIKASNDGGFLWDHVFTAIDIARYNGIKFLNMSFGGSFPDLDGSLEIAVFNAFHAGMLLTAASGNFSHFTQQFPADFYPYVVSVGASLWDGRRWSDSNIDWTNWWGYTHNIPLGGSTSGRHLRFLAPGGRFIPTIKGSNGYANPDPTLLHLPLYSTTPSTIDPTSPFWGFGGTSAAAPLVSGAAALLRSVAGDSLGAEEIAHLLALTARPTDPEFPGYNRDDGWGIIDIESALAAVRPGMRIERGTAVGGTVADTSVGPVVNVVEFPGLPSGLVGCTSSAYNIRRRVSFAEPFFASPIVLKRTHGSVGTLSIPAQIRSTEAGPLGSEGLPGYIPRWEPAIDTLASYPDSCILTTRVYALYKDGVKYWWPCAPEEVRFAYTLAGIPLSALSAEDADARATIRMAVGPSPTRDVLSVDLSGLTAHEVRIDLIDLQGRRCRDFGVRPLVRGACRVDIRLSPGERSIDPGLYFLRARTQSVSLARRVVVLK